MRRSHSASLLLSSVVLAGGATQTFGALYLASDSLAADVAPGVGNTPANKPPFEFGYTTVVANGRQYTPFDTISPWQGSSVLTSSTLNSVTPGAFWLDGVVTLHPSIVNGVDHETYIKFTAPASDDYLFSGTFTSNNIGTTLITSSLPQLFSDPNSQLGGKDSAHPSRSLNTNTAVTLLQGQSVYFVLNSDGFNSYDAVVLSQPLTVSTATQVVVAPEPAGSLALAGVAGLGLVRRRR